MKVDNNSIVTITYSAFDNNTGVLLESNTNSQPLQFMIGKEHIVPGLEKELIGMTLGDKKEFEVAAKEAYGERREDILKEFPIEQFKGIDLKKGMTLVNQDENGNQIYVKVAGFDSKSVEIDFNHPLSGKDLKFQVDILDIREASQDELEMGQVINNDQGCGCNTGCGCH